MEIMNNDTPSLLDFSPVRRLYILFLLAFKRKVTVESLDEETRDYVFGSLTPGAKRFVEKCILKYTKGRHSIMLRDLLDGEFAPETVQLKIDTYSDDIWMLKILPHELERFETLTLLGFSPEIINKELDNIRGIRPHLYEVWKVTNYIHFHCNVDLDDGWKPQYYEPLAEYFSKSDILSKHYRPFIDMVSGSKSRMAISAENNFWSIYEVYLRQEIYIIKGKAIEKASDALYLDEIKNSFKFLQIAGIASSYEDWFGDATPEVIKSFREMPTMISRDKYFKKQLSAKKINEPKLLPSAEESLKPALEIIASESSNDNGNDDVEN